MAALFFATILLLPGGCFLVVGFGMLADPYLSGLSPYLIIKGLVILAVAISLGFFGLRKPPTPPSQPPV